MASALPAAALLALGMVLPVSAASPDIAKRDALVKDFNVCVMSVVEKDLGEANAVAERAFRACGTEEYAIRTWLAFNFAQPAQIDLFLINTRLNLKKIVREVNR